MGMFDEIRYEMDCPICGTKIRGFQSKDGPCCLATLEFWEVDNFYISCPNCHAWIEFTYKLPRLPRSIDDYERIVEEEAKECQRQEIK